MGKKIKLLFSHVVTLEEYLDSRPSDKAEQRRREELKRYIHFPPSDFVLSSPQRVGTNTETAGAILQGLWLTAAC